MFFVLSKLLLFIISPLVWIIFFFFWALFSKKPKRKKRLYRLSFFMLIFFSNRVITDLAIGMWERPFYHQALRMEFDVAIVLGGASSFNSATAQIEWREASDRVLYPLQLYKQGRVKKILISGGSGKIEHSESREADFLQKYLVSVGVSAEDILVEKESRNTYENAVFSKLLLDSLGISNNRLLLVTSALHMRRSEAIYRKAGMNFTIFPVDFLWIPSLYYADQYFVPDPLALHHWNLLVKEVVGYFVYKIRGYA